MNKETRTFDLYVIKNILTNNEFAITAVNDLKSIKSIKLNIDEYPRIAELIKSDNLQLIVSLSTENKPVQYLEIMQFTNQNNKPYIVTIYDSDELWQDPQVIDIFPRTL